MLRSYKSQLLLLPKVVLIVSMALDLAKNELTDVVYHTVMSLYFVMAYVLLHYIVAFMCKRRDVPRLKLPHNYFAPSVVCWQQPGKYMLCLVSIPKHLIENDRNADTVNDVSSYIHRQFKLCNCLIIT